MQEKVSEVVLILVASTLIILILFALVLVAVFVSQKRKFRHRQEVTDLTNNYEKEVLRTQLETQTQTFETISHELHDNVGSLLSIAIVQLKTTPQTPQVNEAGQLLDEALDTLRDISRSINPEYIHEKGLSQSVRQEVGRLKKTGLFKTTYEASGQEFPIEPQREVILFRIIQEALNNALRHSGGDALAVRLDFREPLLNVHIQDNGKGFGVDGLTELHEGSGLRNMHKRATLIGARLHIATHQPSGTVVHLTYRAGQQLIVGNPMNMA